MNETIAWLTNPATWQGQTGVPWRITEHLAMVGVSILAATLVALPVGLWIGHTGRGADIAISLANIGRAVPSYAVIVVILPFSLAFSRDLGLNVIPTFLAMVLLAIPPILVNAYAGVRGVDRDLVEAARGMGLRERQILSEVEIPPRWAGHRGRLPDGGPQRHRDGHDRGRCSGTAASAGSSSTDGRSASPGAASWSAARSSCPCSPSGSTSCWPSSSAGWRGVPIRS